MNDQSNKPSSAETDSTTASTILPGRRDALIGMGAMFAATVTQGAGVATVDTKSANPQKELAGKVALISGAARNLGRGFAEALARNGANVVVHYHTEKSRADAEQTARLVRAQGGKAALVAGDLSIVANVRKMYDTAFDQFGRLDIVINNAGKIFKKPLALVTEDEFDQSFDINSKGLFFSLQEASKRIADNGRIINIGTTLLGATTGMYSVYAGSKAPVEDFTRALAREIGLRGVTINTIAPGAVNTPFFHGQETPQSVDYVTKAHVLGRLAEVSDIVPMVEFLASLRSQWVSAQTLFVNGAYLAR